MQKTLASRRGSLRFSVALALSAPDPPCPSVLPPGAGNEEAKKALKAQEERAKKIEGRYAELEVAAWHVDAAAVRRDHDGDGSAVPVLEVAHACSSRSRQATGSRSVTASGPVGNHPCRNSLAGLLQSSTSSRLAYQPQDSQLLVVRRTRANRTVAAEFARQLRVAHPAHPDDALAALTTPSPKWPGAAMLSAAVEHGRARLLSGR
jgi:hypothetical protein